MLGGGFVLRGEFWGGGRTLAGRQDLLGSDELCWKGHLGEGAGY